MLGAHVFVRGFVYGADCRGLGMFVCAVCVYIQRRLARVISHVGAFAHL